MADLKFVSSRGGAPPVSLSEAMEQGLAPDGGLYVPSQFPTVDRHALAPAASLPRIARASLAGFFQPSQRPAKTNGESSFIPIEYGILPPTTFFHS